MCEVGETGDVITLQPPPFEFPFASPVCCGLQPLVHTQFSKIDEIAHLIAFRRVYKASFDVQPSAGYRVGFPAPKVSKQAAPSSPTQNAAHTSMFLRSNKEHAIPNILKYNEEYAKFSHNLQIQEHPLPLPSSLPTRVLQCLNSSYSKLLTTTLVEARPLVSSSLDLASANLSSSLSKLNQNYAKVQQLVRCKSGNVPLLSLDADFVRRLSSLNEVYSSLHAFTSASALPFPSSFCVSNIKALNDTHCHMSFRVCATHLCVPFLSACCAASRLSSLNSLFHTYAARVAIGSTKLASSRADLAADSSWESLSSPNSACSDDGAEIAADSDESTDNRSRLLRWVCSPDQHRVSPCCRISHDRHDSMESLDGDSPAVFDDNHSLVLMRFRQYARASCACLVQLDTECT